MSETETSSSNSSADSGERSVVREGAVWSEPKSRAETQRMPERAFSLDRVSPEGEIVEGGFVINSKVWKKDGFWFIISLFSGKLPT
ncbi:hypothetical protein L596_029574 [Steinernema carpocapsae]|uniref:Uncharacterized protein n=1 Tax=Steinernema carpocapsae TaxID=34508 RepID=A0A4U5LV18_STECR|nr:hypothetical protein L596_029574 [Steinernema carpocapsae]